MGFAKERSRQHFTNKKKVSATRVTRTRKSSSLSSSPSSSTSSKSSTKSIFLEDLQAAPVIKLDERDSHYFHHYNHFASLNPQAGDPEAESSDSSDVVSVQSQEDNTKLDIIQLCEEYERLHPPSVPASPPRPSRQAANTIVVFEEPAPVNFKQVNRELKQLTRQTADDTVIEFAPMSAVARKFVHELAACYQLRTHSEYTEVPRGHKKPTKADNDGRFVVVEFVLGRSRMPADYRRIDRLLQQAERAVKYANVGENHKRRDWKGFSKRDDPKGLAKKSAENANKTANERSTTRLEEGTVVGAGAPPIPEDNAGRRMLERMGWKQGDAIGAAADSPDVSLDPVRAVVRGKRRGL